MADDKNKQNKPPRNYSLYKAIREEKLYKSNIESRDRRVRKYIAENYEPSNQPDQVCIPGQMIMFNYFEPKTKEELKYYDAMPCTIFFGTVETKEGNRVLGFNIHYYPPKVRYRILDRIFEIFKPIYLKSWDDKLNKQLSYMQYSMLMEQLASSKLDFGVRMYIPNLMNKVTPIPPKEWSKVVFSEGKFKKVTRLAIMNYWKNKRIKDE